jgi:ADP-ribose pyrophosphatase YjhB (NUDIX family)
MGEKWCHLGGRVFYGETLADAASRHLTESLSFNQRPTIGDTPYFVNQYFPSRQAGMGYDPRKHAIAACFMVDFPPGDNPISAGTEALAFQWFRRDSLPAEDDIWPGSMLMINHPLALGAGRNDLVAYDALNARYVSHNELMWQTPVLAMTAMAFLLTIALGSSQNWMRALGAALSALVAIISAQLMAKHSSSQLADADELLKIELRQDMPPIHGKPTYAHVRFSLRNLRAWFASKRSRVWWFNGLLLFAAVSMVIAILAVFDI